MGFLALSGDLERYRVLALRLTGDIDLKDRVCRCRSSFGLYEGLEWCLSKASSCLWIIMAWRTFCSGYERGGVSHIKTMQVRWCGVVWCGAVRCSVVRCGAGA